MNFEPPFILAIDQGTTSSRAILFDSRATPLASHSIELKQFFPANGWVEHDAEEIWQATLSCCRVAAKGVAASDIAAIGITNQRETTVLWDRKTGEALHHAIVWQDRRTAERCRALKDEGKEPIVTATTGLLLDPYFSATKCEWLLDHIPGARAPRRARRACVRHDRLVADLQTHGRQRACDGCDQCLAHDAAQSENARVG